MNLPVDLSTLRPGDRFSFGSSDSPVCTLVRLESGYEQDAEGYDEPGYVIQWTDEDGKRFAAWEPGQYTVFVYAHP